MSVVTIHGTTYNNVEVQFNTYNDPKTITFILNKDGLDLDDVAADFSAGENTVVIDDTSYTGYVIFKSLAYDLNKVVILISQKSLEEQLADANKEIEELQDATAEILEIIGG